MANMSAIFTKRKMGAEDEPIPCLPTDIIFDILIRLSVKSLSRLRLVSRTWLSMISSPEFIREHRQIPLPNRSVILGYHKEPGALTFYTCSLDHYSINYCSFNSLEDNRKSIPIRLELGFDLKGEFLLVVGSCNGLCCMRFYNGLVLCNLSTRKSKFVPKPVISLSYGFGYDDTLDDYKIVNLQTSKEKLVVRVYSLRENSWTEIQADCSTPIEAIRHEVGCPFVSGKLHWLVTQPGNKSSLIVISYDLKTESICELMLPPYNGFEPFILGVYRDCLYLGQGRDAWIMSEYGAQQSWENISSKWSVERKLRMAKGWGEMEDDGLVCNAIKLFPVRVAYNVESHLWYNGLALSGVRVVPYIESLVPPTF